MTGKRSRRRAHGHGLVREVFLRGLGVVHVAAFASLAVQVRGLLGADGLVPAAGVLAAVGRRLGAGAPVALPTVFWLSAGDTALTVACWSGAAAGGALAAGLLPLAAAATCWVLLVSLAAVGEPFLLYQWDALLLEAGFLALFWAPATASLRRARGAEPSSVVLWLLRWLVLRLMFASGWVKLASGDPAWRTLDALRFHFETQPLPSWTSGWAHGLPVPLLRALCALTLAIELPLALFVLLGRRGRAAACAGFLLLQAGIAATGNYGFFNLLTAVLCVPLLDDDQLRSIARAARRLLGGRAARDSTRTAPPPGGAAAERDSVAPAAVASARRAPCWRHARDGALATLLLAATLPVEMARLGAPRPPLPAAAERALAALRPLHPASHYGLFAVMTTTRPEIAIEGSDDGVRWQAWVPRWKPGPTDRAPAFTGPHMPRLDWQFWFDGLRAERALAAGGAPRGMIAPRVVERLLAGSTAVRDLFADDPFGGRPPRWARWALDDYRFTDPATRAATGRWWTRRRIHEAPAVARP